MLKRQQYITLGVVLLVALVLLNLPDQTSSKLKLALSGFFLPLFGLAGSVQGLSDHLGAGLSSRASLLREIEQLRRENEDLRSKVMQLEDAWRENTQLRQAAGWQARTPWALKLARVVGHDPANWWRTILIDVGRRDKVQPNMTVLAAEGLVGRITNVGFDRSQVVLIGDPSCHFSAQVQDPNDRTLIAKGIIEPNESSLNRLLVDLTFVPGGSLLKPGQPVVTSGDGGVFPKGIVVGQIVDVRTNDFGLNLEARVKLAVNLNKLEAVWVMTQ
jgi:rod shape-determining protein MreC